MSDDDHRDCDEAQPFQSTSVANIHRRPKVCRQLNYANSVGVELPRDHFRIFAAFPPCITPPDDSPHSTERFRIAGLQPHTVAIGNTHVDERVGGGAVKGHEK
jgi:hypothetical protein